MSEVSRRDVLKAIIPGAWALEFKKGQGVGGLSTAGKIGLVKDVVLFTGGGVLLAKEKAPKSFKEKVLTFNWEQTQGRELESFTNELAEEYLQLTGTTRISKADLTGPGKTNYYQNRVQMVQAIKEVNPTFSPTSRQWGFADYKTGRAYIDLDSLKDQASVQAKAQKLNPNNIAGMSLLAAVWHEWGHIDVTVRIEGKYINNPALYFYSPKSGRNELYKSYRGAAVFTETYFGFTRFEEVLNETITVRRIIEQVGMDSVFSAADYYQNGIDFFPLFTSVVGIKLDDLYQMHATSNFEGIVHLIGSHLPGSEEPFVKGGRLVVGIHQSNSQLIQQTGVHSLLPKK